MATEKLNFALVGCGRIAQKYSQIFAEDGVPGATISAVCDVDGDRAAKLADRHNVPAFDDYREMLKRKGNHIDVVCVLTESGGHEDHMVDIAPFGKHIVVEKPMALTLEGADRMIRAADRSGIKLFVVKQNRYNLPVQKLRDAVDQGRFGKIGRDVGVVRRHKV